MQISIQGFLAKFHRGKICCMETPHVGEPFKVAEAVQLA